MLQKLQIVGKRSGERALAAWTGGVATDRDGMSHILPATDRRQFLSSLLTAGAAGLFAPLAPAMAGGPKDRLGTRLRERREGGAQVPVQAASFSATPAEEQMTVLRESAIGPAAKGVEEALALIRKAPGYVTTLVKREVVRPGGPLLKTTMVMKLRHAPFSVYLKYVEPHAGREVLYVDGQNKGRLWVHEAAGLASWVGTVSFAPTSDKVMEENRYPITMAGIERGLSQLLTRWAGEAKHGEAEVRLVEGVDVGGIKGVMHEVVHPTARPQFPMHKVQVTIHPETKLPMRLAGYGYPTQKGGEAPLVEEYTYLNLRTDLALQDIDFDIKNKSYSF